MNKIYTSHGNEEVELIQPAEMNIYQSNPYRKDLSWLIHFDDEPVLQSKAVKEGSTVL